MIEELLRAMKRTAKALIPLGAALGVALTFTPYLMWLRVLGVLSF